MINVESRALLHMFQQVTPHMDDPENYVPIISSVRLEMSRGWLYVMATDRYTFAVSRRQIPDYGDASAHIPGDLVPVVTAWLDAASERSERLTVTLPDDPNADGQIVFVAPDDTKLTVEYEADIYDKFPGWRKLFHSALRAEPAAIPVTGVTTRFLKRWSHAADKLMVWQEGPRKPIVFLDTLGLFAGMQMPITTDMGGREELARDWITATKPRATVDGVTYDLDEAWLDEHGDPWSYSGNDTPDGMPLMVLDGIDDDPHPLDRLITQYGPLHAAS